MLIGKISIAAISVRVQMAPTIKIREFELGGIWIIHLAIGMPQQGAGMSIINPLIKSTILIAIIIPSESENNDMPFFVLVDMLRKL